MAYFDYYNVNSVLAAVLSTQGMNLHLIDIKKKTDTLLAQQVGRAIKKVPRTNSMSYTVLNEDQDLDLYLLNMGTLDSFYVCTLPIGIQDYTWLDENRIIIGSRNSLFIYDTFIGRDWEVAAKLSSLGIKSISRVSVSPSGTRMAIVSEIE